MSIRILHRRQQWPVGHGFFHTASVCDRSHRSIYRYAYDCGSVSRNLVEEQINVFLSNEGLENRDNVLDMLVLSHFHIDHINGVPHLLKLFKIKKLVLPFLATDFKLAALADLAASGVDVWNEFSGLVLDPQNWIRNRIQENVEITYIGNDGVEISDNNVNIIDGLYLPSGNFDQDGLGTIKSGGENYWDFKFYVNENLERYAVLLGELFASLSHKPDTEEELLNWLSDPNWIAANYSLIAEIYRSLGSSNQNAITLCMYSGPTLNRNVFCELNFTSCGRIVPDYWPLCYRASRIGRWDLAVGWLGTGDAELQSRTSFDAFVAHYRKYLKYVDTLTIPHHGSVDNYCSGLGEIGQCAVLTSDHVNDPEGFHPSDKVMVNLRTKYPFIFIVTRDQDSAIYSSVEVFVR